VDLTNSTAPLMDDLMVTCLVAGNYDVDLADYGCIGN